jgi:hypothetical protein
VNVIGHNDILVEFELARVAIFQQRRNHQLRNLCPLEEALVPVSASRYEVRRHCKYRGAKAPEPKLVA